MSTFRKLFLLGLLLPFCFKAGAQLVVTPGVTATTLASTLAGPGVTILSPVLTCPAEANGTFTATGTLLNMSSGILLTNGKAAATAGPEGTLVSFTTGGGGDPLMTPLLPAGTTIVDACYIDFNLVATGDTVSFNYVFGSEEYRNAVCSIYTDVFGFFISGPGITGTVNMALVPGTNIPVEINSINNGTPGYVGGARLSNCTSLGAGSPFTSLYVDNTGGTLMSYRGYTRKLRAFHNVIPCDTYHLHLSIVDAGNALYDSGVWLEGGSLTFGNVAFDHVDSIGATINGVPNTIVKGCNTTNVGVITTVRSSANQTVNLTFSGTATHGTDYTAPDSVVIPAGDSLVTFSVAGIPTAPGGPKTIVIHLNGTCGSTDSVVINVMDTPSAIILTPDTAVCGNAVTIRTSGTPGLAYSWTPSTGLSSTTAADPVATPTVTTTYSLTATLPGSGCPAINRSVTITELNLNISMLSPDTSVCPGDSVQLLVAGSPSYAYSWTPTAGVSNPTLQDPKVAPMTTTTYVVSASIPGAGCPPVTASVTISIHGIVVAGPAPYTICKGSSVQLMVTGSAGYSYSWYPAAALTSAYVMQPFADPEVTTTYTVTVDSPGTTCPPVSVEVVVNVDSVSFGMPADPTICLGSTTNLALTGTSPDYSYSWTPSTGLSGTAISNPDANPTTTTTYSVAVSYIGLGCTIGKEVTVTVESMSLSMPVLSTSICYLGSATLSSDVTSTIAPIYLWTPSTGLSDANIPNPVAQPSATTIYTLTVSMPGNACPPQSGIETVVVDPPIGAAAQQTPLLCSDSTIYLSGSGIPDSVAFSYLWIGPNGYTSTDQNPMIHDPAQNMAGEYYLTVTDVNSCTATDSANVIWPASIQVHLTNMSTYTTINYGQTIRLNVDSALYFFWTPDDGSLDNPNKNDPKATPLKPTTYTVVGINQYGCTDTDTVSINVIYDNVFIPDAFTPNGDGLNDYFRVVNLGFYRLVEMRIFDRWGNMVYENIAGVESNGWDGTYKGVAMDADVYYYYIVLLKPNDNSVMTYKGDVTLIR